MTAPADNPALTCPRCQARLGAPQLHPDGRTPCPGCGVLLSVTAFPALARPPRKGLAPDTVLIEGEASCFYHEGKKAATACDECGRFLCSLCSIEMHGRTLCSGCIQSGNKKGKIRDLTRHRLLYDEMALAASILPFLIWPVTLITGPLTIVLVILWWKKPGSLLPRTRIRFLIALLFASLQILLWVGILTFALKSPS